MPNALTHAPLLTDAEAASFLRRELRKAIVVVMPDNSIPLWRFVKGQGNNAATFAVWHRSCGPSFPGAVVLNELPFDDAVAAYAGALRQPVLARQ